VTTVTTEQGLQARLAALSTSAVSDALDRLGVAGQALGASLREARRAVGYHDLQHQPRRTS
jgi:hypothetical protein